MVDEKEYLNHKAKCGESFKAIIDQQKKFLEWQGKMDRAMFGEEELETKGVLTMTQEMYKSMMLANGGKRIFWITASIAGSIVAIIVCFNTLKEFIKKIILN